MRLASSKESSSAFLPDIPPLGFVRQFMLRFCLAALAALRVLFRSELIHRWKFLPSASRSPRSNVNAHGLPSTLATGLILKHRQISVPQMYDT